ARLALLTSRFVVLSFFFFQAEDGIRDFHVTGVQTCALPISSSSSRRSRPNSCAEAGAARSHPRAMRAKPMRAFTRCTPSTCPVRSEERRVGREFRLVMSLLGCLMLILRRCCGIGRLFVV